MLAKKILWVERPLIKIISRAVRHFSRVDLLKNDNMNDSIDKAIIEIGQRRGINILNNEKHCNTPQAAGNKSTHNSTFFGMSRKLKDEQLDECKKESYHRITSLS